MRNKHCCDPAAYERYYSNQAGAGLPVFHGAEFQRGHGLGSIFSSVAKMVMPLLKSGAKAVGRQALNTGVQIAGDVLNGKRVKQAAITRSKEAGSNLLSAMLNQPPGTPAKRRKAPPAVINRKRAVNSVTTRKTKRRRRQKDIFD